MVVIHIHGTLVENCNNNAAIYYSGACVIWTPWDQPKAFKLSDFHVINIIKELVVCHGCCICPHFQVFMLTGFTAGNSSSSFATRGCV